MQSHSFLVDAERREERFRVSKLLREGRHYQIALAEDTHRDGRLVCVKAIHYDAERVEEPDYVALRRQALAAEREALMRGGSLMPEYVDWLEIESDEAQMGREPLLVYEYVSGPTLAEFVDEQHPEGIDPRRGLAMFRSIAAFAGEVHEQGYVLRELDPRHFVVGDDERLAYVGFGSITKMRERPLELEDRESAYVAPEARHERSGKMLVRAADIYGLGALFSFMLTGIAPRAQVENPLTKEAFDRLSDLKPPGISLIVARCLQPLAKKRFTHIRKLLPFCEPDNLPTASTEGFGLILLPAPWSGAESPETNRALRSQLSPGALISVPRESRPNSEEGQSEPPITEMSAARRLVLALILGGMTALVFAAFMILRSAG